MAVNQSSIVVRVESCRHIIHQESIEVSSIKGSVVTLNIPTALRDHADEKEFGVKCGTRGLGVNEKKRV